MLCYRIIATMSRADIKRILIDDDYIYRLIVKEVRGQDFNGDFLDTIIQTILDDKRRMEMCGRLDKLSLYFYENLDIHRLRSTLQAILNQYDIELR